MLFPNINSSASSANFFENRFNIKLLFLFNQYEIASNPRPTGIDVCRLSMSHKYKVAS